MINKIEKSKITERINITKCVFKHIDKIEALLSTLMEKKRETEITIIKYEIEEEILQLT